MTARCHNCKEGPRDIHGHDHLHLSHSEKAVPVTFECEMCGARWSRSYVGEAMFAWTDITIGLSSAAE